MTDNDQKIIVYTSITGGKDAPRDDIKVFDAYDRFKDPRLNAKIYKVLPHLFLDNDTEYSIFVDGNLFLKVNPQVLVNKTEGDIAVFEHHARNNIFEEAESCKRKGLDDPDTIDEQINRYRKEGFNEERLGACFLIIRRHTEKIARLNERWWAEITSGSVRDQISFPYVYRDAEYLPLNDVKENQYFKRVDHRKGDTLFETASIRFRKIIEKTSPSLLLSFMRKTKKKIANLLR